MRRALVTRGYRRHELTLLYEQLEVGDLLEFRRRGFSHWAIYMGYILHEGSCQHCVIHRSLPEDAESPLFKLSSRSIRTRRQEEKLAVGSIQIDSIEVAFGCDPDDVVLINNEMDNKWPPFEKEEIIARAMDQMNAPNQEQYNLVTNNCEHFVTRCRYGKKHSRQIVEGFVTVGTSAVGLAASLAWRSSWKAALPVLLGAAAAAGFTVNPAVVAVVASVPTVAALVSSAAPPIAHAVENHRARKTA